MMEYSQSVKIKAGILLIVVMSIMGWLYECAFYSFVEGSFIRRGFGLGPWIPIYGVGTALYLFVTRMKEITATRAFMIGFLSSGIIEFTTGWSLYHFADGLRIWDYNTEIWNYLIPNTMMLVEKLGKHKSLILSVGLSLIFLVDIIVSYFIKPFWG